MLFSVPLLSVRRLIMGCILEMTCINVLVKDQLSPTCTLLTNAPEFWDHFLQTAIINSDRADSIILPLYLG